MSARWHAPAAAFGAVIITVGVAGWVAGGWLGVQANELRTPAPDPGVVQCELLAGAEFSERGATMPEVRANLARMGEAFALSGDAELRAHGVALAGLSAKALDVSAVPPDDLTTLFTDIETASAGLDAACARYGW